jgi:hypothetical protein
MAASNNTFSTPATTVGNLNGLFKQVYADKLKDLIPDGVKALNMIDFNDKADKLGDLFHQPVILGMEHGITFAAATQDAFNLNPAIAGQTKDAQIQGCPAVLRSVLGYNAASRSQSSEGAFQNATKYLVSNMLRSMARKLEAEMFYGQVGYATVNTYTSNVIAVNGAEWAPGIWVGAENMPIEIRDSTGATSRGTTTIASVDMNAQTLTTSSTVAGVVNGDVIWHLGAYGNEFAGIHQILSQSSGTLFNINVGTFNLFRGNTYSASSAALSFPKLNQAAALAIEKGCDSKLTCFVNPRAWANMLTDQAALRKYDSSYSVKRLENGSEALEFHSQNGVLEIISSIFVKQGYCYMLALDDWMRVGSSDITFKRPGHDGEFFRELENAAGFQLSLWTDQALFCQAPGHSVLINNIVNAS